MNLKIEVAIDVQAGSIIATEFIFLKGNMKNGNKKKKIYKN